MISWFQSLLSNAACTATPRTAARSSRPSTTRRGWRRWSKVGGCTSSSQLTPHSLKAPGFNPLNPYSEKPVSQILLFSNSNLYRYGVGRTRCGGGCCTSRGRPRGGWRTGTRGGGEPRRFWAGARRRGSASWSATSCTTRTTWRRPRQGLITCSHSSTHFTSPQLTCGIASLLPLLRPR